MVTSTPLLAGLPGSQPGGGGGGGGGKRLALEEEEEEIGGGGTRGGGGGGGGGKRPGPKPDSAPRSRPRPPTARPPSGSRTSLGSTRGGGAAAAGKGLLTRKKLALGQGAPPAKGVAAGLPLPGKGVKRAIRAPASHRMPRGSALPGKRPGCPRPSQLQGQKQLPDEMKKCLTKLPCYKGTSVAIQAPPKLTRGGVAGGTLAYVGLGRNASCAENEMPRPKLPVRIGLMEKHAGGTLLAAGQIPRAVPGSGHVALCMKCVKVYNFI